MKTLKLSLALILVASITAVAQIQTMAKPVSITRNICLPATYKKAVVKKPNALYQCSIQRTPAHLIDTENRESKSLKSADVSVYEVKAFPNPFTTQIDVIITDGALHKSVYKASLYDLNGKRVFSEVLSANQSSLSLAHLSAGMYLLHIHFGHCVICFRKIS